MIRYIIYGTYNLVYQLASFFVLLYANTYINDMFVPEGLEWKGSKPRTDMAGLVGAASIKTLLLVVEAIALMLLIYYVNKRVLNANTETTTKSVVRRTAIVYLALCVCFIAILTYGSYKGLIW